MKTIRILLLSSLAALSVFAQAATQTVTLTVTMSTPVLIDIHQHWLSQKTLMGAITGNVDATSSTITVTISQAGLAAAVPLYTVGQAAIIGTEPATVTAVSGGTGDTPQTVTLRRNDYVLSPMATHAAGDQIHLLKYATPWVMLGDESLRPYAVQLVQSQGANSHTFAATVTGSLTVQ